MVRFLALLFTVIIVDLYLFPLVVVQGINTKMLIAVGGLFCLFINKAKRTEPIVDNGFLIASVYAGLVSLIGLFAVSYNDTEDYTYATYIMSMWVWLGGAYAITNLIAAVHNRVTISLIGSYLMIVAVAQCILALLFEYNKPMQLWAINMLEGFELDGTRMFGFGAALDPAGIRFAAILVIMGYCCTDKQTNQKQLFFYLLSFFFVAVVGNMISRTTTVGIVIVILYWVYFSLIKIKNSHSKKNHFWSWLIFFVVATLAFSAFLYTTNPSFSKKLRFGFEGFFSLVEKGTWEVHSNEVLENMIVFPDNVKTWLIGDGYIENPYGRDPYYTGPKWRGYYMGTDIGYLRFIFYFGLIGLLCFCAFFIYIARCCTKKYKAHTTLFLLLLALNFIVWFKVSTDIFCVFAFFLAGTNKSIPEVGINKVTT